MRKALTRAVSAAVLIGASSLAQGAGRPITPHPPLLFGRLATQADIAPIDIDVAPDGVNLPAGHGTAAMGARIYAAQCSGCHGDEAQGFHANSNNQGIFPALKGGQGTLNSAEPKKTIGSYWPYATTVFDYIRRAMPFPKPQSLSNNQVYALTAFLLWKNGIVPYDTTMDKGALLAVRMPNANGFYPNKNAGPVYRAGKRR